MKKGFAFMAVVVLLFAACGREGPETEDTLATAEPLGSPTASPGAEESPASAVATDDGTTATSAPAATTAARPGTAATSAPAAKPAAPGRSNPPQDGTYVYALSGTRSDPFNPAAGQEKFSGEQNDDHSHSGNVYTLERTNTESPGRTTMRTRRSSTKVELLSLKTESQGGDFGCTYDPPLIITKFPIKPETYPKQEMKGEGNACNGTLEITIERQETVKDATGRSWSTWRVKVRTTVKSDQLTVNQNETRWVSPDLGVEIRSQGTSEATFGAQKFTQSSTSALKKRP